MFFYNIDTSHIYYWPIFLNKIIFLYVNALDKIKKSKKPILYKYFMMIYLFIQNMKIILLKRNTDEIDAKGW